MKNLDLSVVVIARNEEKNIASALGSTLQAIEEAKKAGVIEAAEVIFVDSASTDRTVAIARGFPVKVVLLPAEWPLSPGAGVFCGYQVASGTYMGVVDGDVTVDRFWYRDGLKFLMADEKAGCVYGWWEESSRGSGILFRSVMRELDALKSDEAREVDFVGNGIFRRSALDTVGGHNPFLRGSEDKDISFRLRHAGYRLLQIPVQFGVHHWDFSLKEYYRSMRGWSAGEGHATAYARMRGDDVVATWFSRPYDPSILKRIIRHAGVFLAFLLCLAAAPFSSIALAGALVSGLLSLTLVLMARRNDPLPWPEFLFHFFNRIPYTFFRFWHFHKGLSAPTPDPLTYPSRRTPPPVVEGAQPVAVR